MGVGFCPCSYLGVNVVRGVVNKLQSVKLSINDRQSYSVSMGLLAYIWSKLRATCVLSQLDSFLHDGYGHGACVRSVAAARPMSTHSSVRPLHTMAALIHPTRFVSCR